MKKKRGEIKDEAIKRLLKENEKLKKAYLELLEEYLKSQEKVHPDIITELSRLKESVDELEESVHIELDSVIKLVTQGEGPKAVKDLAKIVENKLKEKVAKDQSFKKDKTLFNLLEHAKHCKWIQPHAYAFGQLMKAIRNKESHELAVKETSYRVGLAIFSGIEIIYDLK